MGASSRTLAVLVAVLGLGVAPRAHAAAGAVGEPAPAFQAVTPLDGHAVSLAQQRGTAVLLNKWATWCKPCVEEMPFLEEIHQRHRKAGFKIVGIAIDRPGADRNVLRVAKERGVTYPIWLDPEDDFTTTFRSTGVPESILLDKNGIVVRRWPGALNEDDTTIDAAIERAVAGRGEYRETAVKEVKESSTIEFGLIGILAAILAGVLSFLSPCVLPLVPSYVAFLAGVSGTAAPQRRRSTTMTHAAAFVIGFSTVFILLGISATALGGTVRDSDEVIARGGGLLLIAFGLVLLGAIPFAFLQREIRLLDRARGLRRFGPVGSGVVGAAFGAGWTPCIGPVLAGILALAATSQTAGEGAVLLGAYSAGLAVPFLGAALAVERFDISKGRLRDWMPWMNRISGALLIGLGILLLTGAMTEITQWLSQYAPSWMGLIRV